MSEASLAPGKRLSQIRQQLGLSQRRVAELSGLTHSAISTIEQDKVSPAISTLQKLLKVYGLSLSEFFAEPEAADEPRVVIDAEDLIEIGSGVSMKLVHNGSPTRNGDDAGNLPARHYHRRKDQARGEEIGTLLEGEIVLTINGQSYCLTAGQSYAINTGIPHSFSNTSARICRIVSAHTPPPSDRFSHRRSLTRVAPLSTHAFHRRYAILLVANGAICVTTEQNSHLNI